VTDKDNELVRRLRGEWIDGSDWRAFQPSTFPLGAQAADEIERLLADNERLRDALAIIDSGARRYWREGEDAYQFAIIARAALEGDRIAKLVEFLNPNKDP
jgi:hypothetical protein